MRAGSITAMAPPTHLPSSLYATFVCPSGAQTRGGGLASRGGAAAALVAAAIMSCVSPLYSRRDWWCVCV